MTNNIHVSELLKNKWNQFDIFKSLLNKYHKNINYLQNTSDIWCRDYMPVRVNKNKLVQFRYEPSYLNDYTDLRSIPVDVNAANGIEAIYADINLDGGNVVFGGERVIISDRIFLENPNTNKKELLQELERLLEAEVMIFPSIRSEITGHADGMVRFYNANTILLTDPSIDYRYWQKAVDKFIALYKINVIIVPAFTFKSKQIDSWNAIGCYINYFETDDLIVVPQYECEGNKDAATLALIRDLYPNKTVEGINCFELAKEGGILNCVIWN